QQLYESLPAADFGPLALEAVRRHIIHTPVVRKVLKRDETGKVVRDENGKRVWEEKTIKDGLSRELVNQRVGRIKRMFRWAISKELIPAKAKCRDLDTVKGLQAGRSEAHETKPIEPVAEAVVRDTLPHLLAPVQALVELQLATGMRPGEACRMRAC